MKTNSILKESEGILESKIENLLLVLDEDIRHLEQMLAGLDEMRALVIKQDDSALIMLLENIKKQTEENRLNETTRSRLRKELADEFDCDIEEVRLSKLAVVVPIYYKSSIIEKRERLIDLVEQLRREYSKTSIMLSECARFNRMLIQAIFGCNNTTTYSNNGKTKQNSMIPLVSTKL